MRNTLDSLIAACKPGYVAVAPWLVMGAIVILAGMPSVPQTSNSKKPAPTVPISAAAPPAPAYTPALTPVQASIPSPAPIQNRKKYIIPISEGERNFLERVVFSEAAFYDENRRPEGRSIEEYVVSYRFAVENIVNIMDNRRTHELFVRDRNGRNFFYVLLPLNQFSAVYLPENKRFFFKPNAPGLTTLVSLASPTLMGSGVSKNVDLWLANLKELISYANVSPITEEELRSISDPSNINSFGNLEKKLNIVREGVNNYLTGVVQPRDRWVEGVLFYKNSEVASDQVWNNKCLGSVRLAVVGEDSNGLSLLDRHQFYKVVGRCN